MFALYARMDFVLFVCNCNATVIDLLVCLFHSEKWNYCFNYKNMPHIQHIQSQPYWSWTKEVEKKTHTRNNNIGKKKAPHVFCLFWMNLSIVFNFIFSCAVHCLYLSICSLFNDFVVDSSVLSTLLFFLCLIAISFYVWVFFLNYSFLFYLLFISTLSLVIYAVIVCSIYCILRQEQKCKFLPVMNLNSWSRSKRILGVYEEKIKVIAFPSFPRK